MFFESIWMMAIMVAAYIGARIFDIMSSQNFDHYGLSEGVEFSKDEWGNFHTTKNAIGSAVFMAAGILLYVFLTGWAWFLYLPLIGASIFVGIMNFKAKSRFRARQIEILRVLAKIEPGDDQRLQATINAFELGWLRSRTVSGEVRHFFQLFKFLYVTGSVDAAPWKIALRMHEHSRLPENQWFNGK